MTADPVADPATTISSFTLTSAACATLDGIGRVDNGELVDFSVDACDNGRPGARVDVFGISVPALDYSRSGTVTEGEVTITSGDLEVTTATTGPGFDGNGYTLTVDGANSRPIEMNATERFRGLPEGSHTVELSRVAANCTVSGSNPRTVTVVAGSVAGTTFSVSCSGPIPSPGTGDLTITTSTTGEDMPVGYAFSASGPAGYTQHPIGANETVTIAGIAAGDYELILFGAPANWPDNCPLGGANSVTVPAGGAGNTTFEVTCTATAPTTGDLTVITSTTGLDLPSGYTVSASGVGSGRIGANDIVTATGIAAGDYTVELSDVAANCTLSGSNPRVVTVPAGGLGSTTFEVSCAPVATALVFTVQPSNTLPTVTIDPPVEVTAVDARGNAVASFTGLVTIAIGRNGGLLAPGTLSGTTTVSALAGTATFSDLVIDQPGTRYTLVVTAPGLTGAESASFDVLTPLSLP